MIQNAIDSMFHSVGNTAYHFRRSVDIASRSARLEEARQEKLKIATESLRLKTEFQHDIKDRIKMLTAKQEDLAKTVETMRKNREKRMSRQVKLTKKAQKLAYENLREVTGANKVSPLEALMRFPWAHVEEGAK